VSLPASAVLLATLLAAQAGAAGGTAPREAAAARAAAPAPPAFAPPPGQGTLPSLVQLWGDYVGEEATGDQQEATRRLAEIRRQRIERNIDSVDTIGLGLVERGAALLEAGERDAAETALGRAVDLAPGLPDGHYGLSVVRSRKGPFGMVPSIRAMASGLSEFLPTARGGLRALELLVVAGLLAVFAVTWALATALALRHGGLLRHDLEEWLGPAQSRSASLALFLLLMLLPLAAFQGWGWLPLWWLALLFPYFGRAEKVVSVLALVLVVAAGPSLSRLETRLETARNPLFWAAISAVEGEPGAPEAGLLAEAVRQDGEDRDLAYLLASAWRRSGRYADAAELYGRLLERDRSDPVARNNLANLEFAWGASDRALERYRVGAAAGGRAEVVATFFYNLSIAHLQKFEYQAYNEARSNADRLAPRRVASYDRWRYDSGDYAVVDVGLSSEEVWRKFHGAARGVAARNVFGTGSLSPSGLGPSLLLNRFTAFAVVFVLVAFVVGRVRGPRAFTVHCSMCATAFCRQCHLGQGAANLCSQCHHLFVVRDGVSAPTRNRKMAEVQDSETRRARAFRVLSVLSPGAGHLYVRHAVVGLLLMVTWYSLLAGLVASRLVPLTEVSSRLTPPWGSVGLVVLLVLVWGLANRFRPELAAALPVRRPARRVRGGQG